MLDSYWEDAMRNPKESVRDVAIGAYSGMQRTLLVLGIEIKDHVSK